MMVEPTLKVGQVWKDELGNRKLTVTAIEGDMVTVKRADTPKKNLRTGRGGYLIARSEFAGLTLIDEGPVF